MKGKTLGPLSVPLHNMDPPLGLVFQRSPPTCPEGPEKGPGSLKQVSQQVFRPNRQRRKYKDQRS